MGRRSNYGYEKKQREMRKQKKKEAKAERKRLRKLEEEEVVPGAEELGSLEDLATEESPGEDRSTSGVEASPGHEQKDG